MKQDDIQRSSSTWPCPPSLSPAACEIWFPLAACLARCGTLRHIDVRKMTKYCALFARYIENEKWIRRHGFIATVDGVAIVRPEVNLSLSLSEHLLRMERHLLMTPAARAKSKPVREKITSRKSKEHQ